MTAPHSSPTPCGEAEIWEGVSGTWRPLFGSYLERGISIEWHDFQIDSDIDWAPSFHEGSLEICLNFSGAAQLQTGGEVRDLAAGQWALYRAQARTLRARRLSGSLHRFLTVELSRSFLQEQCGGRADALKPGVGLFLAGGEAPPLLEVAALNTHLLALRVALLAPPVPAAATETWFLAKTLEVLAHTLFQQEVDAEFFCQRHQRLNRERVDRVCYLVERDLENPPSLEMLAREVGCSTFHLSRIFAEASQMSIPKYLRLKRVERAAELLRSRKMNVTEAAMAVGYASLSAFNKAFVEQMGCCPGLYPVAPILGRVKRASAKVAPRRLKAWTRIRRGG